MPNVDYQYEVIFKNPHQNLKIINSFDNWDDAELFMYSIALKRGQSKELVEWQTNEAGDRVNTLSIEERFHWLLNPIYTFFRKGGRSYSVAKMKVI